MMLIHCINSFTIRLEKEILISHEFNVENLIIYIIYYYMSSGLDKLKKGLQKYKERYQLTKTDFLQFVKEKVDLSEKKCEKFLQHLKAQMNQQFNQGQLVNLFHLIAAYQSGCDLRTIQQQDLQIYTKIKFKGKKKKQQLQKSSNQIGQQQQKPQRKQKIEQEFKSIVKMNIQTQVILQSKKQKQETIANNKVQEIQIQGQNQQIQIRISEQNKEQVEKKKDQQDQYFSPIINPQLDQDQIKDQINLDSYKKNNNNMQQIIDDQQQDKERLYREIRQQEERRQQEQRQKQKQRLQIQQKKQQLIRRQRVQKQIRQQMQQKQLKRRQQQRLKRLEDETRLRIQKEVRQQMQKKQLKRKQQQRLKRIEEQKRQSQRRQIQLRQKIRKQVQLQYQTKQKKRIQEQKKIELQRQIQLQKKLRQKQEKQRREKQMKQLQRMQKLKKEQQKRQHQKKQLQRLQKQKLENERKQNERKQNERRQNERKEHERKQKQLLELKRKQQNQMQKRQKNKQKQREIEIKKKYVQQKQLKTIKQQNSQQISVQQSQKTKQINKKSSNSQNTKLQVIQDSSNKQLIQITKFQKTGQDFMNPVIKYQIVYKQKYFTWRRYSQIQKLLSYLRYKYQGIVLPQMPPKQGIKGSFNYFWKSSVNEQFLDERKQKLKNFLNRLIACQYVSQDEVLQNFLKDQQYQLPNIIAQPSEGSYLQTIVGLKDIVFNYNQLKDYGIAYYNYISQYKKIPINTQCSQEFSKLQALMTNIFAINKHRELINSNFQKRRQIMYENQIKVKGPTKTNFDKILQQAQTQCNELNTQYGRYIQLKSTEGWENELIKQKSTQGGQMLQKIKQNHKKTLERVSKIQQNLIKSIKKFEEKNMNIVKQIGSYMMEWRKKAHP